MVDFQYDDVNARTAWPSKRFRHCKNFKKNVHYHIKFNAFKHKNVDVIRQIDEFDNNVDYATTAHWVNLIAESSGWISKPKQKGFYFILNVTRRADDVDTSQFDNEELYKKTWDISVRRVFIWNKLKEITCDTCKREITLNGKIDDESHQNMLLLALGDVLQKSNIDKYLWKNETTYVHVQDFFPPSAATNQQFKLICIKFTAGFFFKKDYDRVTEYRTIVSFGNVFVLSENVPNAKN